MMIVDKAMLVAVSNVVRCFCAKDQEWLAIRGLDHRLHVTRHEQWPHVLRIVLTVFNGKGLFRTALLDLSAAEIDQMCDNGKAIVKQFEDAVERLWLELIYQ